MDPQALAAFVALDVLLVLTPGADWAFMIAAGLRGTAIAASVAGLAGGYAVHAALVSAGLGAVIAGNPGALSVLTAAGAAYLVWLGVGAARHPARVVAGDKTGASHRRTALRGAAVSGLNPKGLLLYFAVLPQFVSAQARLSPPLQLAVLGAIHIVTCIVVYFAVAAAAQRVLSARPRASEVVARASGLAMITVAATLTAERVLAA